ncbi:ankyrin repeat and SOCS box protein 18 isoform X2 [Ailuropoda melanoleuca]|uniref:ankyrin repeat and SOCS box protein 18 isoform X2 n=1 Tax=Ailuropoda melanoleuca TaxID=9646 RepID=UPI000947A999|nr:ankyrin repeat and SOCS box protein 18 isoform X2 [Ailuropoda melanoleuca]
MSPSSSTCIQIPTPAISSTASVPVHTIGSPLDYRSLWTLEYKRELTTPLCIAAARGHTACVRHLLSRGADPDASPGGQGALHEACLGGHTACAQLLLQHSADPDLLSAEGLAPLHLCRTAASLGSCRRSAQKFFGSAQTRHTSPCLEGSTAHSMDGVPHLLNEQANA